MPANQKFEPRALDLTIMLVDLISVIQGEKNMWLDSIHFQVPNVAYS